MASDFLRAVKERVSLEALANYHGIEFDRNRQALCPFHDDKNPSFSLHPSGAYARCFSCDKSYDVIELELVLGRHVNKWEAAKALNDRYGLKLKLDGHTKGESQEFEEAFALLEWYCGEANKSLLQNEEALNWLEINKGITIEDVKEHKIGYVGSGILRNKVTDKSKEIALKLGLLKEKEGKLNDAFWQRLIFPVYNRGKIISLWTREWPDKKNSSYKWLGLPSSEFIPNKPLAFVENLNCDICVITESIPDALAFLKVDIPSIALLGSYISQENKIYFEKSKAKLYFALDPDEVGKQASYKLAKEFKGYAVNLGYEKDPDEILADKGTVEFKQITEKAISEAECYLDLVIEREEKREALEEISKLEYRSDRDPWLRKLALKYRYAGVTLGSLKADLKDIEKRFKKDTQASQTTSKDTTKYIAIFDGLVDLVYDNGQVGFLVKEDDNLDVKKTIEINGEIFYPPPRNRLPSRLLLPKADKVIEHYAEDKDSHLYDDLIKYLKQISELPGDEYYDLLATWVLHTYLLDNKQVQYSPYMWIYAIPERGKSRTGKGAIYVAYRGIHVESLRDAYLIRVANDLGASIFFDAMDLWKKAERAASEDILLQRFEKGALVPRVLYPEKGAHKDTKYFDIFGATIIGTNEPVHKILESRAVLVSMPEASNDYDKDVTPELALPYKERLVAFRARNLDKSLPEMKKPSRGRLGDILKPLLQVMHLVKPEKGEGFKRLILQLDKDRKIQKSESIEARLLSTVIELENQVESGMLHVKTITDYYNESIKEKFHISPNKSGWRLKAMGFRKGKDAKGAYIEWDNELIDMLSDRYGLTINSNSETTQDEEAHDTPSHSEKIHHNRHDSNFVNDGSKLESDDVNDNVSTMSEPSEDCHDVSACKQKEKENDDENDVYREGAHADTCDCSQCLPRDDSDLLGGI